MEDFIVFTPIALVNTNTGSQGRITIHVFHFKVYEELDGTGRAGGRGLHNSGGRGGDEHLREGVGGEQGDARGRGDGNPAEDEVQAAERMGVTVREVGRLCPVQDSREEILLSYWCYLHF